MGRKSQIAFLTVVAIFNCVDFKLDTQAEDINGIYLEEVGSFKLDGGISALLLQGNHIFAAGNYGLAIIDISNPTTPVLVSSIDTLGEIVDVFVTDSYAYLLTSSRLKIVDIGDCAHPKIIGDCAVPGGSGNALFMQAGFAYTAGDYINLFDISDPTQPKCVSSITGIYAVRDIAVAGEWTFVVTETEFLVINVKDPSNPVVYHFEDLHEKGYSISVRGEYGYVGDHEGKFKIINIKDPLNPTLTGFCGLPDGASSISLQADYAYAVVRMDGFYLISIKDPARPYVEEYFLEWNLSSVAAKNNFIFLGGWGGDIEVLEIKPVE
jgi:hypothetical protein